MAGRPPLGDEAKTHIVSAALDRAEWEALQRVRQVRYHLKVLDEKGRRVALDLGPIPPEHLTTAEVRSFIGRKDAYLREVRERRRLHRELRRDSTISRIVREAILDFLAREDPERTATPGAARRRGGRRAGGRRR